MDPFAEPSGTIAPASCGRSCAGFEIICPAGDPAEARSGGQRALRLSRVARTPARSRRSTRTPPAVGSTPAGAVRRRFVHSGQSAHALPHHIRPLRADQQRRLLLAAFVFGTLIGAERQYRQRSAGLRTNALVAVGAAAFIDFGLRVGGPQSTQVMAYVVSGIGFLGAGAIMKEGLNVRGLNTAATLWCSAAVGAAAGAGLVVESAMLTGFVIAGNTLLRPLVNRINRIPLDEQTGEATYEVRISVTPGGPPACARR